MYEGLVAKERLHRALSGRYPMDIAMKAGNSVKVYRSKRKLWEGPMTLVSKDYDQNLALLRGNKSCSQITVSIALDQQAFFKTLLNQNVIVDNYVELQTIIGTWAWFGALTSPQTTYMTGQLMQITEQTVDNNKTNHLISMARSPLSADAELMVPKLGSAVALRKYSDAAFGNSEDLPSQVGCCVMLYEEDGNGASFMWTSKRLAELWEVF
ncbi:hypothetical protein FVE85_0168 [Porphyridium purpureum]|uniref:Uncharacterized protein n=1 Tax=Porphyridium purpureum TaxID=35688 RepID=A0A5J4YXX3_PORPP|nr:hypothetical protein FVE85_0168 [Porphyridium purpureum]|eukprot:POR3046..scf208_2